MATTAAELPRIEANDLLVFDDVRYTGYGRLVLQVASGTVENAPAGIEWLPVQGARVHADGQPCDVVYVLVKTAELPEALAAGRKWKEDRQDRGPRSAE